ncbi:tyrosine-type recombinase/integrase [uncultured Cohaesibacter sp.]|uniref:tyrosine-type recombinase/integrase n=1 Tax=uncultured Cohaesibacter sp. TaxID=1002546 RepID=UPI00292F4648|nr:tyrosine-type recombinase/integrase [uncultured Cohaesibacter sp.]
MKKYHPKNERIKRDYLTYLQEAKKLSPQSVDQAAAAIAAFEAFLKFTDFAKFRIEDARRYKDQLNDAISETTGKPLSKATIHSRLMALKAFFIWLAGQPGYKSKLQYSDADYFNPSNNDTRIAKATYEKPVATLNEIRKALGAMPHDTDFEKRDRAVIAFTLLSGARDAAIASMKLRHVNIKQRKVFQEGRDVRTKNRKTFTSQFFPVGNDIEKLVTDWIIFLREEKGFGPEDPLFPKTKVGVGPTGGFEALDLSREHWANASPIRDIFKRAFASTGLPYFNPHSFRNTLARLGEADFCRTPEEFKAWSQNLGHDHVMTTLTSYGAVAGHRQAEIMNGLTKQNIDCQLSKASKDELMAELGRRMG